MHEVLARIEEYAEVIEEHAAEAEELGRLPDTSAKALKDSGLVRLLQPREYGGYECHPIDFFEAIFALGPLCGSTTWVAGVVGVHPWQLGQWDHRLQQEIWGEDPDTWVASPYAPLGRARKVEGGYRFGGRWPFSSGTDHCEWVVLGGLMVDDDGTIIDPEPYNFILPRADYTIHHDSWDVMGLRGTGSKDVSIDDKFVPGYRVARHGDFQHGIMAKANGRDDPLYQLPFGTIFPAAINAATMAICQGALAAFMAYTRKRVSFTGAKAVGDGSQLITLGEAAADIRTGKSAFMDDWRRLYDHVAAGKPITDEQRLEVRSNSVRAARRSVEAVDRLFMNAGGGSLQHSHPLQRFWRDAHAAMNHICNYAGPMYTTWSQVQFGLEYAPAMGW